MPCVRARECTGTCVPRVPQCVQQCTPGSAAGATRMHAQPHPAIASPGPLKAPERPSPGHMERPSPGHMERLGPRHMGPLGPAHMERLGPGHINSANVQSAQEQPVHPRQVCAPFAVRTPVRQGGAALCYSESNPRSLAGGWCLTPILRLNDFGLRSHVDARVCVVLASRAYERRQRCCMRSEG